MADSRPAPIHFRCGHCRVPLKMPADRAHTTVRCPQCHQPTLVPAKSLGPEPVRPDLQDGPYQVWPAGAQLPAGDPTAHQPYIPVLCKLCQTLMHATEQQVGQAMICPDCGTENIVPAAPRPRPRKTRPVLPDPAEELALAGPEDLPAGDTVYIPIYCPQCRTRMLATDRQVGQRLTCPDCAGVVTVPAPPVEKSVPRPAADDSAPLELEDPIERPPVDPAAVTAGRAPTAESAAAAVALEDEPLYPRPAAPRHPFWSGVYGFWLRGGAVARWLGLSALGAAGFWLATTAVEMGGNFDFVNLTSSMFLSGLACLVGLIWLVATAAHVLAILHDTSYGYDAIVTWPGSVWLDWGPESIYVLNSFALSCLAGTVIAKLLQLFGQPAPLVVPATVFLLFPVILLSMLEAGSCLIPITWLVARTTLVLAWAWSLFYLEAAVVVATAGGLAWWAFRARNAALAAVTAPLVVAGVMVYFRLLGRLAWVCSTKLPPKADEEDDDDGKRPADDEVV